MTTIPSFKTGDQFKNKVTGTTNTIILIDHSHWYSGSKTFAPYYTLQIEGTDKKIQATPAMLYELFTQIQNNNNDKN